MTTEANLENECSRLKERVHQLETCYKITSLLNSELNLAHLLDSIMNIAKTVMKADACSLLLTDAETGELVFQIALSEVGDKIMTMNRLKLGQGIAGTVAKSGKAVLVEDAYTHPQFNPDYDRKTGFRTGSLLCSPLKARDAVIGVCQVIHGKDRQKTFRSSDLELFQMFCDSAALAIQNARVHQILMENQRLEKDMEFAKSVQESFLPASPPKSVSFVFAGKTVPARVVGGDYYDFIPFDDHTMGIVLGDVSGKGVPAALQMARLMSDFRYISQNDPSPVRVLSEVNRIMCRRSQRGMFTTILYLLLDMRSKTFRMANGGHHPLLIWSTDGTVREQGQASGPPLGIMPDQTYREESIPLNPGDLVVVYTDGVTEPKNRSHEEFGTGGLTRLIREHANSPGDLIRALEQSIRDFTENAPQFDDLTCVAFKAL